MTVRGAKRARRRLPWWLWTLIGAGSLVGVVALLGGFNEVPYEDLPEVQLGQQFAGNEVALQVDDIYLTRTEPVTDYEPDYGYVYLVVEVTAENVTARPNIFLSNSLKVIVDGAIRSTVEPYSVVRLTTGRSATFLQPGLPTRVAFLWSVDEDLIDPGDQIRVGLFERYDRPEDPRFDDAKTAPTPIVRLDETIGTFR